MSIPHSSVVHLTDLTDLVHIAMCLSYAYCVTRATASERAMVRATDLVSFREALLDAQRDTVKHGATSYKAKTKLGYVN